MTTPIVFVDNQRVVTDTLMIAETFGKNHKDVLRDIRNLECSADFNQRNFAPIDYKDNRKRTYQKYLVTQDGFTFLVMGYTGKDAAQFKEMYINEFNRMREVISTRSVVPVPQNPIDLILYQADMFKAMATAMADNQAKVLELENKVGSVEAKAATKEEVNELRKGLVDIDAPLRTDLQSLITEYSTLTGKPHRDAWHFLYDNLNSRNKCNIQRRFDNKLKRDPNYKGKKLDIIEELRLLPDAIRFMKAVTENLKLLAKQMPVQVPNQTNEPF